MSKSAEAFRTIGEVADELDVPKHVLRFWEGKFPHIRPMKRGGGRRYYRPEDMELLRGIRHLLHAEGYTIKGVQKILREQGIDQVKAAAASASAASAKRGGKKQRGKSQPGHAGSGVAALKPAVISALSEKNKAGVVTGQDIVAAAIRELELCRQLLLKGSAAAPAAHRVVGQARAARS